MTKINILIIAVLVVFIGGFYTMKTPRSQLAPVFGDKIDSLNGVVVYYNGQVGTVKGRNRAKDGYNIGLKYQCVEFVKRYYYEYFKHKMPNSYGHAKSFFNTNLKDGTLNKDRNLIQYTNASKSKPKANDLLVYGGTIFNRYGHVSIVSKVMDGKIEIIQQNPGVLGKPRVEFDLKKENNTWKIENNQILGWLRMR
ncbi:CHAP domain-containing protein [Tenacibaculum finnmarkense]|uniref:CHAP domain-containing protein n=1 Tax=Tenacibaculum finnmarkense TaxID=2781243 RepID=UPI001EFB6A27|nr:CHAP domain-containing protein [Tenacibaculum finnmarkense]MCG8748542.1 CHAP domain-containing protein [Tenacibaculum finnmarkense]MCG8753561.1 CHAP domain-containing protein [Tenacibaculum finnmarkense]MCG8782195.1 CHAP domain-containing protein [Tenacibaculum finnmarkense]